MRETIVRFAALRLKWFVRFWYNFTMRITRHKNITIPEYTKESEIVNAIDSGKRWRPDPLGGILDVVMHPSKFQKLINEDNPEFGDCDDHAIYWIAALLKNNLAKKAWFVSTFYYPNFAEGEKRKLSGHAMCVYLTPDNEFYWCDYHMPRKIPSVWSFIEDHNKVRHGKSITGTIFEIKYDDKTETPFLGKSITKVFNEEGKE